MTEGDFIQFKKEIEWKFDEYNKRTTHISNSMESFHKSFRLLEIDLAAHFEGDKSRNEKIKDLVDTIKHDNGQPCLITRLITVEKYITTVDNLVQKYKNIAIGIGIIIGLVWTILVVILPFIERFLKTKAG